MNGVIGAGVILSVMGGDAMHLGWSWLGSDLGRTCYSSVPSIGVCLPILYWLAYAVHTQRAGSASIWVGPDVVRLARHEALVCPIAHICSSPNGLHRHRYAYRV